MRHETTIRSSDHYHIALCSCGWIGYPFKKYRDADDDADGHVLGMAGDIDLIIDEVHVLKEVDHDTTGASTPTALP